MEANTSATPRTAAEIGEEIKDMQARRAAIVAAVAEMEEKRSQIEFDYGQHLIKDMSAAAEADSAEIARLRAAITLNHDKARALTQHLAILEKQLATARQHEANAALDAALADYERAVMDFTDAFDVAFRTALGEKGEAMLHAARQAGEAQRASGVSFSWGRSPLEQFKGGQIARNFYFILQRYAAGATLPIVQAPNEKSFATAGDGMPASPALTALQSQFKTGPEAR